MVASRSAGDYTADVNTIIGLILLVIWIYALIDILKSGMDLPKKILWIVLITFLPLIGVILYFLLGRK